MATRYEPPDIDALVDGHVDAYENAGGHDGWVAHQLLHLKAEHLGGDPLHWTRDDLAHVLLELVPRKVTIDPGDLDLVMPAARTLLRFLHDSGRLTGDPLPRLLHALDQLAPAVADALRDEKRYGMGKRLGQQMLAEGVDLGDHDAVQAFIGRFNDQPMAQRRQVIPDLANPYDTADLPPAPPLVPVTDEVLAQAAEDAPLYRWVAELVRHAADAPVALTKKGNLRLAEGRALSVSIDTGDRLAGKADLRSTAHLPNLDLAFRVARAAGFVKVRHGRVEPTKRAADLWTRPATAWPRVVEGLLSVGILAHAYDGQPYLVPPWYDDIDDTVEGLLGALYLAAGPVTVEELADGARLDVGRTWRLDPPTAEGATTIWWDMIERDVRTILDRLAQAGVCVVHGVQRVPRRYAGEDVTGGEVSLTAAGRMIAAEALRADGIEVPEAGGLRDLDALALLHAVQDGDQVAGEAEIAVWIEDRGAASALAQLVEALDPRPATVRLEVAALALTAAADTAGPTAAEEPLRRMLADRLLAPVVGGWLLERGVDVQTDDRPLDVLLSMAAVGAPDEAVMALQGLGPVALQTALIDEARTEGGHDAGPLLIAIADLHSDKKVAKAARKALFRLGVRR